jgi:hypothetical protein
MSIQPNALAHIARVEESLKALEPYADQLDALLNATDETTPGPGHNNPPEDEGPSGDTIRLGIDAANVFRSAAASTDPDFAIIGFCRDALLVVGKWALRIAKALEKAKKVAAKLGRAFLLAAGVAGAAFLTTEAEIITPHINHLIEETWGKKIPWLEPMSPDAPADPD